MATTQNYNYNPSSAGGIVTNDAKTISDTIAAMQKQAISSATPVAQVAENARLAGTLTPTQSETLKSADYQTRVPTPVIVSSTPIAAQNNANLLEANDLIKKFSLPLAPFQTPANPLTPESTPSTPNAPSTPSTPSTPTAPKSPTSLNQEQATKLFGKDMTGVKYDPNTGTYTPDDSALARVGMTREQFANTSGTGSTNTTGGLAVNTELQKSMEALNKRTIEYDQQMQDIRSGKFMNQADQAQLDAIQQSLDRQKREQSKLNSATEAAVQQGGIRSGRSRYMSEEQDMILGNAISQGQQQLSDIEARGFALLTQTKQALQDKEMKQLNDSLIAFKDNEKDKQDVIQKMYENVHAVEREKIADERTRIADERAARVESREQTEKNLPFYTASLVNIEKNGEVKTPTESEISKFALDHGLDAAVLSGAVNARVLDLQKMSRDQLKDQAEMKKPVIISKDANGNEVFGTYNPKTNSYEPIHFSSDVQEPDGSVDPQLLAYAQVYASTGQIPSGIPKGAFGKISQMAKELPKTDGFLYDTTTGVKPSTNNVSQTRQDAITSLFDLTKKIDQAKELFDQIHTGIVAGSFGSVFPSEDRQRYNDLRGEIVDLLARARTGAAINASEEKLYASKLPGNFNQSLFVGGAGDQLIKDLRASINGKLESSLETSGLSIKGFGTDKTASYLPPLKASYTSLDALVAHQPEYLPVIGKMGQDHPEWTENQKLQILDSASSQGFNQSQNTGEKGSKSISVASTARTDRHNNPTAFTTGIAREAGLKPGIDYTVGDPFSNGRFHTAKLIGDPIDTTIKVIDRIGFYTPRGTQRWTHTAMPKDEWDALDHEAKKKVIQSMYSHEGGKTLKNIFV